MVSATSGGDAQSAGSRNSSVSSGSSDQRSNETAASAGAVASAQASARTCGDDLARTAASGKPVSAGEAMRTMDERTGSRLETDAKVEAARTGLAGTHGALNGSLTNLGKVDATGASHGHGMHAGIGRMGVKGDGLFSASGKGAGVATSVGLSAGPVTVQQGIEAHSYTDNSRFSATTTTAELATTAGAPAAGKLSYRQRDMCAIGANPDGTVSYSFTGEMRLSGSAAGEVKQVAVSASAFDGHRTQHTVTLPAGADLRAVDPTRPDTWPDGTRVKMDDVAIGGGTLAGGYGLLNVELGRQTREGGSVVAERLSAGQVRTSVGPTSGYTHDGKLKGPDVAGFGAELSARHDRDVREHGRFDVDPRSPAGLAAFQGAILGRAVPTAATPGISNFAHETVHTNASAYGAKITTPLVDVLDIDNRSAATLNVTQTAGGVRTETYSIDADGDGTAESVRTATQVSGMREAAVDYRVAATVTAGDDLATVRQGFGRADIEVGARVEVTLDSAQMEQVRLRDRDQARPDRFGVDPQQRRDVMAASLAYARGAQDLLRSLTEGNMARYAVNRQPDLAAVPGTVTVHPGTAKPD